ncbi:MAG: peptidoglycan editing factor PgeF [Elusimicrobiota bacterium]|jgi:YfiH family protein|nr:peptidoglycan editing factor PgeF [Elusimicrobiota bacterium]
MKIFSDERLVALGYVSGTVSKHTGSGRDKANVERLMQKLGIEPARILGLNQVHGDEIIKILNAEDLDNYRKQTTHNADGWLLGLSGVGALILTADCVPLYIWDDDGKAVSLTHCGWRGVVAQLPKKAAKMVGQNAPKAKNICAFIGPHISACCFEVKEDVANKFNKTSIINKDGKLFVDLANEITLQLTAEGVKKENIKTGCNCQCTACNKEDFFSYRRDKTKDALISFVYKI